MVVGNIVFSPLPVDPPPVKQATEVRLDTSKAMKALDDMVAAMSGLPFELGERFRDVALKIGDGTPGLFRFEHSPATGALVVVRVEPGELLLDFISACGTRELDKFILKHNISLL